MLPASVFIECTTLVVDAFLFSLFYGLYKTGETCLKALKEAQTFEINSELLEKIKSSGGIVPYAIVSGNVKALSRSLKSQYFSSVRGVILEKKMLRIWNPHGNNFQHSVVSVPFALYGRISGLFKKQTCVEIIDPLTAEGLTLPRIYEEYNMGMHHIGEGVINHIFPFVFQAENMLMEDSTVTAVGKLIIDKEKVKIMPPDPGLNYYVTSLTLDSLIKKVSDSARFHKFICIITGAAGLCLFAYIVKRGFIEIKRQINQIKRVKEIEEMRRLRMTADSTCDLQANNNNCSRCIVCVQNPVEILITKCGHACVCLNCSRALRDLCPVCRSKIASFELVILPLNL